MDNLKAAFPETKNDINELKKTVTDASHDLASTAAVHAQKAKAHVSDLATHFQEEAPDQLNQVRTSLAEVVKSGLEYVSAKPAYSLGIALGVGVLIGLLSRSSSSRD
jgi:ElaB/YqjD/DUF883 family membrane-anchored ribosome-binding protein